MFQASSTVFIVVAQRCSSSFTLMLMITSQMVRLLLREGANPDVTDKHQRTALHWAAYMGHGDVIRDLVHCGANVNTTDTLVVQSVCLCVCVSGSLSLCLSVYVVREEASSPVYQ